MISYERLWKTLKDRGISQYALINTYGVSPGQLTRLRRNESVSTHTIDMFCRILRCKVEDVMEYLPEKAKNKTYEVPIDKSRVAETSPKKPKSMKKINSCI